MPIGTRRSAAAAAVVAVSAAALAATATGAARAQGTNRFDGTWSVVIACAAARDGAAGYTLRFPASVKGGILHGEYGVHGQAGSLSLDGQVQPDGTAMLSASGMTGDPTYTIGRLDAATPYFYHLRARFEGNQGTATRIEARRCDATFSKQ